jgi:hypothetical protein
MTRPGHPDRKRTPSALAGRGSQCRSQQARSAHPRLAASGLCNQDQPGVGSFVDPPRGQLSSEVADPDGEETLSARYRHLGHRVSPHQQTTVGIS